MHCGLAFSDNEDEDVELEFGDSEDSDDLGELSDDGASDEDMDDDEDLSEDEDDSDIYEEGDYIDRATWQRWQDEAVPVPIYGVPASVARWAYPAFSRLVEDEENDDAEDMLDDEAEDDDTGSEDEDDEGDEDEDESDDSFIDPRPEIEVLAEGVDDDTDSSIPYHTRENNYYNQRHDSSVVRDEDDEAAEEEEEEEAPQPPRRRRVQRGRASPVEDEDSNDTVGQRSKRPLRGAPPLLRSGRGRRAPIIISSDQE